MKDPQRHHLQLPDWLIAMLLLFEGTKKTPAIKAPDEISPGDISPSDKSTGDKSTGDKSPGDKTSR